MSADAVLWIVMAFCLIVGCPIFVSLGVASTLALILTNIPMRIVALDMLKVMDMFPLLAVVGFIFAGALMEKGGMARQIVDVASLFVGRIRGGLGITTILGCLFFAAMIGSGPGTVAAMGSIMIPTMVRRGYSPEYAAGVCATGGTLGILIPPSNPMIIYGIIANTSIAALFTAGFVPGFVLGLMMMLMAYFLARRAGYLDEGSADQADPAKGQRRAPGFHIKDLPGRVGKLRFGQAAGGIQRRGLGLQRQAPVLGGLGGGLIQVLTDQEQRALIQIFRAVIAQHFCRMIGQFQRCHVKSAPHGAEFPPGKAAAPGFRRGRAGRSGRSAPPPPRRIHRREFSELVPSG